MDIKKIFVASMALVLVVASAGCSNVSDKVAEKAAEKMIEKGTGGKVDIKGEDVTFTSKEGDAEVSIGSKKLPDNFPKDFPVYKGAEIEGSMTSKQDGKEAMMVTFTVKASYDKVVEFYKNEMEKSDYEVASTLDLQDAFTMGLKKGDEDVGSVMIAKNDDNTTGLTLNVTR